MQDIQLLLTVPEVNQILDALGEKSYKQVYQLIIKIQQQAEAQLQSHHSNLNGHQPELITEAKGKSDE
ncbi:hypothetical protein AMR41_07995 [Hapalosiphon sp. MRB220]|nr:hypothetical protein AMR41_07995 [Hapalosiphon sp. MRB220]